MRFFRQALTIAHKDLRAEFRSKETINASLSFAVVILLIFSFAFDPTAEQTRAMAGGLLWIVFAFAGALVLNRSFSRDLPNDCLDMLISAPISGASLFLGKALANYALLLLVEMICLPVFGIFYNINLTAQLGWLILVIVLATWGLTVVGTVFSALTVNLRLRELMLPVLVYPIMIPELLGAIVLSAIVIPGNPVPPEQYIWLKLIVGFDVIYTSLALALVETVLVS